MNRKTLLSLFFFFASFFFLSLQLSCRSQSALDSDVLTEVSPDAAEVSEQEEKVLSSSFQALLSVLEPLGIEAVGLEFEKESELEMLSELFQLPELQNKAIRRLYTGKKSAYDSLAQALTIGYGLEREEILRFIRTLPPKEMIPAN